MPTTDAEREDQLLRRIRAEYGEMPGLRLTLEQAQRLFGVPQQTCAKLLNALVSDRLLACHPDGTYMRRADSARVARATLRHTDRSRTLSRTA
jgi:DNA-binding IclR family transcriptional regulator